MLAIVAYAWFGTLGLRDVTPREGQSGTLLPMAVPRNYSTIIGEDAFWSLVNRYYDPATAQWMSVDPAVATTGQPYVFTGADPINLRDPLGLSGGVLSPKRVKACEKHPNARGCAAWKMVRDNSIGGKIYEANPYNHGFFGKLQTVLSYSVFALPVVAAAPAAVAGAGTASVALGGTSGVATIGAGLASALLGNPAEQATVEDYVVMAPLATALQNIEVGNPSDFDFLHNFYLFTEGFYDYSQQSGQVYHDVP